MREPQQAEEWHDVDSELFEKIKTRGRPAIMRGLVRDWPATRAGRKSPHSLTVYLKTFHSGHPAPLFEGPASISGRFFYNDTLDGFNFESKRATLSDVLERLCHEIGNESAPALYAGSVSLPIYLPGFSNANNVRSLITVESVLESIWIGNHTCIAPHFDNTENLACVVGGRRRFTMFPPDQIGNLYVGPLDLTPAGQPISLVDVRHPDLMRFPRYSAALEAAEVAELSPGDAVYIPCHPQILSDAALGAKKYSWCNPPSTELARTATSWHKRCRELDRGLTFIVAGGSGTPGPNAMCGRPVL
jgi:Cupin-like domain